MGNFKITSVSKTVQGKEERNSHTVNYTYNQLGEESPTIVNFNCIKEDKSTLSGTYYSTSGRFDIQNMSFSSGDFELYQAILTTCKEITK